MVKKKKDENTKLWFGTKIDLAYADKAQSILSARTKKLKLGKRFTVKKWLEEKIDEEYKKIKED